MGIGEYSEQVKSLNNTIVLLSTRRIDKVKELERIDSLLMEKVAELDKLEDDNIPF